MAAAGVFVLLAVLVGTGWGPLRHTDVHTAEAFNRYLLARPGQAALWRAITDGGAPATFEVLTAVAAVLLWARRRRDLAVFVVVSMVGELLLSRIVKLVVDRSRPSFPRSVAHASGASFPSGHALASFVAVAALLIVAATLPTRAAWRVWVAVGVVVVAAVGFSRVALSVHYLSDVLASWLLGAAWLLTLIGVFRTSFGVEAAPDRDGSPAL